MPETLIDTSAALERLCAGLDAEPWIALDTEFMRTRTYYAQPCLVQVGTPQTVACVDALRLVDIAPLLDVVYAPGVLKVLHSARQDLELFSDLRGAPPVPIFDTQVAAMLAGFTDQISYAALVETVTGRRLAKAHTRTDWAARPLSAEQLRYAADDVRYLRDVYAFLLERLTAAGRLRWLEEEMCTLTEPARYRNEPGLAYQRLRAGHQLPTDRHGVLRELAAWREGTAQTLNLPRTWVLDDGVLIGLARAAPRTCERLRGIAGVRPPVIRKWGEAIVEAVSRGLDASGRLWDDPAPLTGAQQALYTRLRARVREVAERESLSATLVATREELLKLLRGDTDGALLRGWRRDLVGRELFERCRDESSPVRSVPGPSPDDAR